MSMCGGSSGKNRRKTKRHWENQQWLEETGGETNWNAKPEQISMKAEFSSKPRRIKRLNGSQAVPLQEDPPLCPEPRASLHYGMGKHCPEGGNGWRSGQGRVVPGWCPFSAPFVELLVWNCPSIGGRAGEWGTIEGSAAARAGVVVAMRSRAPWRHLKANSSRKSGDKTIKPLLAFTWCSNDVHPGLSLVLGFLLDSPLYLCWQVRGKSFLQRSARGSVGATR